MTDPTNCGQCNLVCSVAGSTVATYACVARVCGIGTCVPGRGNCNQQYGDGCEADLGTDVSHCGAVRQRLRHPQRHPGLRARPVPGRAVQPRLRRLQRPGGRRLRGEHPDLPGQLRRLRQRLQRGQRQQQPAPTAPAASPARPTGGTPTARRPTAASTPAFAPRAGWRPATASTTTATTCIDEDFDLTSNALALRLVQPGLQRAVRHHGLLGVELRHHRVRRQPRQLQRRLRRRLRGEHRHRPGSNCGACNNACTTPNATPRCQTGACGIQSCNTGFANCNNQVADGCEINTGTDLANCGACNNACVTANGTPRCLGGACGVQSCNTGFANCNNVRDRRLRGEHRQRPEQLRRLQRGLHHSQRHAAAARPAPAASTAATRATPTATAPSPTAAR